jgi:Na+-transporting methylmalonyl-CoA/oxaloacetate decarboxylase gamma subunit
MVVLKNKERLLKPSITILFSTFFLTAYCETGTSFEHGKTISLLLLFSVVLLIYFITKAKKRKAPHSHISKENIKQSINFNNMKDKNEEIVAAIAMAIYHYECEHEQGVHEVEQTGFRLDKTKQSHAWANKIFAMKKMPNRVQ